MIIYLAFLLSIGPIHFSSANGHAEGEESANNLGSFYALTSSHDVVFAENTFGCDEVIFLSDPFIVPAYYQALNQIIAEGILLDGSTLFRVGEEIILSEGFEVTAGATFEINIGPCIF